jgi:hypothetical protein
VRERDTDLAHIARDDRTSRKHRFEQRQRQSFGQRREREQVRGGEKRGYIGAQAE